MEEKVTAILKKHQLSITEARKKILSLFWETGNALAHGDIEQKSSEDFDRVTIYRTLQTFVEKGIIHTIPTSDNSVRYALCKDECAAGHHHDDHVHFICDDCGTTYCIDEVSVPKVKLPKGFSAVQTDLVISGTCNKCEQ
ncbi:Fur family transcriptional regulator [Sediminibacterium sp.]|jgi:Fur family ferric uptake transcriptional regulator|uniref:Fur family transcriptional regulator n=1 Tax=Sediminibacterium sp. TaxID=1917865 RepID=UPI001B501316|nr:transcriptional repressor [Sediminibacterium sp.]MBP7345970.1 transcriptional repressor [Sediminibacterium sp.]MDO8995083.1 transcriptional repressor [Sediminibacterium sp.]MDO9156887.1 transcriptional repressor [Sediminibacterium sp.]MDP1972697.1 transcriptional repressor [Sediminibacterium sp.]MDP2419877.1 transcriptional repressor [Sediminibacterium sp.]